MVLYMSPRSSPVVQVQVPHHNTTPTPDLPTARYIHRYSDEPPRALPRGGKTADPRDNPSAWFADWELASMGASQGVWGTCSPPAGTPERCCVGASSSGGAVRWVNWECTDADNHFKVPVPPPACTGIWNQSLAPSIRKGFLAGIQPHHHVQICRSPPPSQMHRPDAGIRLWRPVDYRAEPATRGVASSQDFLQHRVYCLTTTLDLDSNAASSVYDQPLLHFVRCICVSWSPAHRRVRGCVCVVGPRIASRHRARPRGCAA